VVVDKVNIFAPCVKKRNAARKRQARNDRSNKSSLQAPKYLFALPWGVSLLFWQSLAAKVKCKRTPIRRLYQNSDVEQSAL
jgi:hypothetical protein